MQPHPDNLLRYFAKNLNIVVGLVLIWRGIWHTVDVADYVFFADNPLYTAIGGIIVGLLILYAPDHNLDEIKKL